MISAHDLSPAQLAALLHFHADAGVEWLVEDQPVDRFVEFAETRPRQQAPNEASRAASSTAASVETGRANGNGASARGKNASSAPVVAATVAVPDEQVVASARLVAESARSLSELKSAVESFNGCNLKNSARCTVFAEGDPSSGIMVIGPMPDADDDREGLPFAGKTGQLLDRMLLAIGLERTNVLLTNVVPWRAPGNRAPSTPEMDICRPFIERQVALAEPSALLLLGNFTARFFFGGTGTIHTLRGQWRDVNFAGLTLPALASLHPQELLNAPASKALAWQDLQMFKSGLPQR